MRPNLLLFDIDGTLMHTRGVGRRAMQTAFSGRFGRDDAMTFRFDGMTDRLIMRTALEHMGMDLAGAALEAEIDALIELYLAALAEGTANETTFEVCPGVGPMLDLVAAAENTVMGLGTGNVVRGAAIKLGRVGLFEKFSFGGFGDDHIERTELLRMGAGRGAQKLGVAMTECRIVVIGDTPRDVAAAKAIGAECVGVGTGNFTVEELLEVGATCAVRSLAEPEAAGRVLGHFTNR